MPANNILITGGSGFIGQHLVEQAVAKGYNTYALVRASSKLPAVKGLNFVYADVTNYSDLLNALRDLKREGVALDYVIHAAALTKSNSKKELEEVNYNGTYNLYNALEEANQSPQRIVFISSLAACGPEKKENYITKGLRNPVTTYGKSKLKAERYILDSGNIPTVIIRPTAVYGPGEKDLFSVFKMIARNINPVLGFHKQQLTFIYVKDLVEIIFSAMLYGKDNAIYFATDGFAYEKTALSSAIAKALHKSPLNLRLPLPLVKTAAFFSQHISALAGKVSPLSLEKYHELVAESWLCDTKDTFNDLHYTPVYDLTAGVNETTNWYKQNNWIK